MTGNKLIDMVIVGLCTLATMALLGVFVYTEVIYEKPPIDAAAELALMKEKLQEASLTASYKLEPLIINLKSPTTRLRFLDLEIHLVPTPGQEHQDFVNNLPQINDRVIQIAGQMDPDELNSVYGKILLENKLKEEINRITKKNAVKEVLFARFVIQ